MRVMILADGTNIHTRRILDWHLSQGCEVTLVDFVDPRPEGATGYRYLPYPGLRGASLLRRLIGERAAGRATARAAARGLRQIWAETRPDVVHLYQIDSRAYHCDLAGIQPLILSSWGTDINQHFGSKVDPVQRARTARALAGARLILADADSVLERCVELAGPAVPTERMVLGIDTERFRPGYTSEAMAWKRRVGIPSDAFVVFSIRALRPLYRHDQILEAFAQALPRAGRPALLVFKTYNNHGTAAGYQGELRRQAERLGVADRVRWTPDVEFEEMPALYAAADVIVNYPSIDGFPVTFLEAAACERPVITNRLPAYAGTFAERYFQMVEPGDVSALAAALVTAIKSPANLADSRHAARAAVLADYGEAAVVDRLMALYRRVIAGNSSSSRDDGPLPSAAAATR